jgi:hypothetical protein
MNILDLEMPQNDAKAKTIRDYLKALLAKCWEEDEGFSGKRPFGNSGWKYEVYAALIKGEAVAGTLDEHGCVDECATGEADALIAKAIAALN